MIDNKPDPDRPAPIASTPQAKAARPASRRTVKSSELLAGGNELLIEHNGGVYSLRQTSNGKLILTK
jgi:hemin uptake protein HemP